MSELMHEILKTYRIDEWATGTDVLAKAAENKLFDLIRYDNGEAIFAANPFSFGYLTADVEQKIDKFEQSFETLRGAVKGKTKIPAEQNQK